MYDTTYHDHDYFQMITSNIMHSKNMQTHEIQNKTIIIFLNFQP